MPATAETKRLGASTLANERSRSARSSVGGRSQGHCFSAYGATKVVSTCCATMNRLGAGTFPRLGADAKGSYSPHDQALTHESPGAAGRDSSSELDDSRLRRRAWPTVGAADNRECVVVLHGLARSSRSMSRLAGRLSDAGFLVDNLDYPSTREPFDELVASLSRAVEHDSASCPKIDFVGVLARGAARSRILAAHSPAER
jgi:hypothetical protein